MVHRIYVEKKEALRQEAASIKSELCSVLGIAGLVGSAILSSQPTRQAARELTVKDLLDDRDVARLETNISEVLGETL